MAYWNRIERATIYKIHLYIGDLRVRLEDVDENTLCYSFVNLGPLNNPKDMSAERLNYYVQVEAVDGIKKERLALSEKVSFEIS